MTSDFHDLFDPSIKTLLDELDRLIGPLFLVGGTVRNMLQNRELSNELNLLVQRPLAECHYRLVQGGHPLVTLGAKRNEVWTGGHSSLLLPLKQKEGCAELADDLPDAGCTGHISHVEIATFRRRLEHPPTVKEDLLHRDLTVNAMAFAWPNGPLIDPFNGREDLANRRIRFVKGISTLKDDPLRALRFFRFLLQLKGEPDEADLRAAEETSLETIPKKKVRAELDRILSLSFDGPACYPNVLRFFYSPMAQEIFADMATPPICRTGETPANRCQRAINLMQEMAEPDPDELVPLHDLRWAALFYAMGELNCIALERGHTRSTLRGLSIQRIQETLKKFRFPQRRQQNIMQILQRVDTPLAPTDRTLLRLMDEAVPLPGLFRVVHACQVASVREPSRAGSGEDTRNATVQLLDAQLTKVLARCCRLEKAKKRPKARDLALSGGEIVDLVREPPGAWVSEVMGGLLEWISQDPSRNQRAQLCDRVRDWVAQRREGI
ncbi:MAG: CCA tRNA nucleotidyltransferase [Magnetococcales bacterium]|nr:CCA tRNA nucleotidyltransferase [Magnetococcales bacterium]